MSRRAQQDEFNALLDAFEKRFIAGVYRALKQPYSSFVRDVKENGLAYAREQINTRLMESGVATQVEKIFKVVGVFMANRTLRELKKNKKIEVKYATFGFNEEWVRDIINYFRMYLLEKAVIKVSKTTRDHILQILEKATVEGWSNDQIVKEILESPEARIEVRNRARKIVRTETVRAANYGKLLGAEKYEYEVDKEWLSVNDNRVRHSHRDVDGERRSTEGAFSNGLLFPGDPNGAASQTINCRCVLVFVAKRDERGRLIPKRNLTAA